MLDNFLDKADIDQAICNVKNQEADARLISGEEFKLVDGGIIFTSDYHKYKDKSKIRVYKPSEFSFDLKIKFSVPDKEVKYSKNVHRSTTEEGTYMLEKLASIKNGVKFFRIITDLLNKTNQEAVIVSDKQLEAITGLSNKTVRTLRKNLCEEGFIATCKLGNLLAYVATPELMFNNYHKSKIRVSLLMNVLNEGGMPESFRNVSDEEIEKMIIKESKRS